MCIGRLDRQMRPGQYCGPVMAWLTASLQVFHGFVRCGALGAITGVGNALPRQVLRLIELCKKAGSYSMKIWDRTKISVFIAVVAE